MNDSLDITRDEARELSEESVALVLDYFERVAELPVFPDTSAERIRGQLETTLPEEGEPLERLIDDCRAVIRASRQNGHPRFFGYIASPSTPVGAFADLIASALNANVTSWRSSPAPTEVERITVRWLGELIGYKDAGGLLTSGGSLANLNALFIAHRSKAGGEASRKGLWNAGAPMTVYASDQVHLSIPKAADVLGIGREQVRQLKSDRQFKMDVRGLREQIAGDIESGLRPFCIVANAGTTNTGAVDPLKEIAAVAEEHGLWLHVDGAYGALASLDETKRTLFAGIERADSVSLDPHKWLYAPVDCGCLLFRDAARVHSVFSSSEADYIKVHEKTDDESFAFWDYGVELSRRFRALKIWLMLRYYGTRRVSEAIAKDNALAIFMAERIEASEDFELLAPVELSVCCFRYVPPGLRVELSAEDEPARTRSNDQLNELNARVMHRVQRAGRAYISNATLRGRYALRACITNFRTTREDIIETLEIVREAALEEQGAGGVEVKAESEVYGRELKVALQLAREAGAGLLEYYDSPLHVERKVDADQYTEPVTQADRFANELIVSGLRREFPEDGILAEESIDTERRLSKRRVWMVDPMDGTNGFIARDGDFAVQIGLAVEGRSVLGVVYQPLPDVLYRATEGAGAWVERKGFEPERARVSDHREIARMRLAASRNHRSPRMDVVMRALGIEEEVRRGSVGIKVGLIIERQCDLYIHLSPRTKQWDTCAPEIILAEAGGRMTDLFGQPLGYNNPDVQNRNGLVASNGAAHDAVIGSLAPLLKEFGRKRVDVGG
ncbi:MAG: aminotransferase class I/II-fold pyridoxal phosphate-dependent enzyme [Acidobacteriota bacterium]|nr:aminotransferase class I/II-fold pyridoxal phosphate-dependent enzyme [Acidobacteriota bacterium]